MPIATTNPATGETVRTFEELTAEELEARLAKAAATFVTYRRTALSQRAQWLNAAADILEAEANEIGAVMTTEMGKTLAAAKAEVLKCAKSARYYAENAEGFLADEPIDDPGVVSASQAYTRWQPLGPVLAVMPWNFPL